MQQLFTQLFIHSAATLGQPCTVAGGGFLGLPHWYKYLNGITAQGGFQPNSGTNVMVCVPQISGLSDVWLIVAAVVEILLRLAALFAIGLVVYGGVRLMTGQGDPGSAKAARQIIVNALIGLVIAIAATAVISFIAGRFS
jgi:hypothetical protein